MQYRSTSLQLSMNPRLDLHQHVQLQDCFTHSSGGRLLDAVGGNVLNDSESLTTALFLYKLYLKRTKYAPNSWQCSTAAVQYNAIVCILAQPLAVLQSEWET